jgi:hypothetical protein
MIKLSVRMSRIPQGLTHRPKHIFNNVYIKYELENKIPYEHFCSVLLGNSILTSILTSTVFQEFNLPFHI